MRFRLHRPWLAGLALYLSAFPGLRWYHRTYEPLQALTPRSQSLIERAFNVSVSDPVDGGGLNGNGGVRSTRTPAPPQALTPAATAMPGPQRSVSAPLLAAPDSIATELEAAVSTR